MNFHSDMAWPPATYDVIARNHSICWLSLNFSRKDKRRILKTSSADVWWSKENIRGLLFLIMNLSKRECGTRGRRRDLSPGHIGGRHVTHHYACAIRASSISNTRSVCFHKTKLVLRFLLLWWDLHSLQWSKVKKNEMKTPHPWITPVYRFFLWRINKNFGNIKIWYPPSFA